MGRFDGRVVLVSGSASGIGRATARRFGSEGALVLCTDIRAEGARETAAAIEAAGGKADAAACDISDPASVSALFETLVAPRGKLDALANVAGIGGFRRTVEVTFEDWSRMIGVNLTGTFLMCQRALPLLLASKGSIVNTASVAGLKSHPYAAAYCASKGGVVAMTKALAAEFARKDVRVNCVCPGGVETPLLEQFRPPPGISAGALMRIAPLIDRMGTPDEVASAIVFLSSSEASYMNGSIVVVDGAMIA